MNKLLKYGVVAFVVLATGMGVASIDAQAAKKAAPAASSSTKDAAAPADGQKDDLNSIVQTDWGVLCDNGGDKTKKPAPSDCEAYSIALMKYSKKRFAEIDVSFPKNDPTVPAGMARGVIILPLGILLDGGTMAIDDAKPFAFKNRFCTERGCYSIVNFSKDILDSMAKGKVLNITFKTRDGRDIGLPMKLKGFDKQLAKVK